MASALATAAVANFGFAKRAGPAQSRPSRAGARRSPLSVSAHSKGPAEEEEGGEDSSARAFRRALGQSANYSRKHMKDADAAKLMEEQGVGVVSKGELGAAPRPWVSLRGGLLAIFRMLCERGVSPHPAGVSQAASSSR